MRRILFAGLFLAYPVLGIAQTSPTTFHVKSAIEKYDDTTPLGHAMNLCQGTVGNLHRHLAPGVTPTKDGITVQYDPGWEACNAVHAQFDASGAASAARDAADKATIANFAKGLSTPTPPSGN